MRHLYLQIYVAFIVILMVFLFLMSMAWWLLRDRDDRIALDGLALLAHAGEVLPAPPSDQDSSDVRHLRGTGPVASLRLPDGRWIVATRDHRRHGGDASN